MAHHLSTLQLKQLCVGTLPEDSLAAAAVHTSVCQSCHNQFVEELKRQRGSLRFNFTLEPKFWFQHDHVDFDQLVALADKTVDRDTEEIINIHLRTCETCREDARSFLAFRGASAGEIKVSYGPIGCEPTVNETGVRWWERIQEKPVYAIAAIVLLAIAVLSGVIALSRRSGPHEANRQDQPSPGIERGPTSPLSTPNVSGPSSVNDSAIVATLKDGGGDVTIDRNGRVTGLDEISEHSHQYIARVVLSEQIEPSDVLRRLAGEQSGLRGGDNGAQGFRLLYPVRRVVAEKRPTFRWESLPGVSSYQVFLMDANGNHVGQSEALPPTKTRWQARASLDRGQIFTWMVIAEVNGKRVVSPSASAPETKFAVLSAVDLEELSQLKKSKSHLALGVFYARVGFLNEAELEFQHLVEVNPQSELSRKLLQSVRKIRKRD